MYINKKPVVLSPEGKEDHAIANWAFNSHWWVEDLPGHATCKWCGRDNFLSNPINKDFKLCTENYAIKKFLIDEFVLNKNGN